MKVLIIEDDTSLRKILADKLNQNKIDVQLATTGAEALEFIKSNIPNLIVLDIMLPGGMNGFDILEQLKKSPIYTHIPVLVLTNLDTEQKTAMQIGATDYIVKADTSIDNVILKIKRHLK